ncbi:MAG: ATP-binding cassette domain-containing protein [Christensenellales bacterium]
MLRLTNITKDYLVGENTVRALKGVSLDFNKSEFVSVLGPSGCGKTTLLNIIGGLDRYTDGDLVINGRSTKEFRDSDWDSYRNDSIGFVFQSYNLISHQTVLGNVELALTLSGVSLKERKQRAVAALESVGLKDQINKMPNQLSGGQMQRVALARALVNNPDILLADEPTRALDSENSVQIMELLKEISQTKLVIMVTHNSELAYRYSSRIVRLFDGEVVNDEILSDNSAESVAAPVSEPVNAKEYANRKKPKTRMSFVTALQLSLKNLFTKKTRTVLTSFAGSIGIIGVALVLSLSNGFNSYIGKMQSDTLATYPVSIESQAWDMGSLENFQGAESGTSEKFPDTGKIYPVDVMGMFSQLLVKNDVDSFVKSGYLDGLDKKLYNSISYGYSVSLRIINSNYKIAPQSLSDVLPPEMQSQIPSGYSSAMSIWSELIGNEDFISSQYDVIAGTHIPSASNVGTEDKPVFELALVVNSYNEISTYILYSLGLIDNLMGEIPEEFDMEDVIGKEFKLANNDVFYAANGDYYRARTDFFNIYNESDVTLRIVSVLRRNENTAMGALSTGINYPSSLTEYFMNSNKSSAVYLKQKSEIDGGRFVDVTSNGSAITNSAGNAVTEVSEAEQIMYKKLGAFDEVNAVYIYPVDFNSKKAINDYISLYNEGKSEDDPDYITPTDYMEILTDSLSTMVDVISYVLIAFTAISLVVSSIMIGIITYTSVLERTKEIGILRSLGARKKDISRVFNAETMIVGFTAGIIGICLTLLLNIPINIIITGLAPTIGTISVLNPVHAVGLVVISVVLTLISGLIPARIASRKDPVIALRTE